MRQAGRVMLLAVLTGLLISTFVLLFKISHDGIAIRLTGRVEVTNATTGVTGEVSLVMPNPVSLIATGPRQEPIPANLSLIPCPKCGGTMLPVRFNLWTGAIEWRCLTCGYTSQETEGGHP